MPQFAPSESKTAVAPIAVMPSGLSCEAEVFLGPDDMTKVATSGRIPFTSTGASQDVRLPVTMPVSEGTYHVYVDVYVEGLLIAAYQAIEDVIIAPVGVAEFSYVSDIRLSDLTYAGHYYFLLEIDIQNVGEVPGVCTITNYSRGWHEVHGWSGWSAYGSDWYFVRTAELAPGEVKTFSGRVNEVGSVSLQYKVESEAGEILSPLYPPHWRP